MTKWVMLQGIGKQHNGRGWESNRVRAGKRHGRKGKGAQKRGKRTWELRKLMHKKRKQSHGNPRKNE